MPYVTWLNPGEGTQFPVRLSTRLRAWWEGYDLSVLHPIAEQPPEELVEAVAAAQTLAGPAEPCNKDGRPLWSASRMSVAERLWGEDFLSPGGVEHTMHLVKPFGITPSMSILDLAAGLGGVARTMARDYKAWINGMEASPLLAAEGQARSEKLGMAKSAPIELYDPNHLELTRKYDGIFSKESFFTVQDKEHLLAEVVKSLKPGGQFLFTDYCVEPSALGSPALTQWMAHEPVTPALWTPQQYIKALRKLKLDVRTNEDMTPLQRQLILSGLGGFLHHLEAHQLDQGTKHAILDEVSLWARRMAAFDAGLRVYRFYCLK